MNWRPIRGWTKPLHERGMKAGSMPERLLIGPGSPPSIDPVHPELSPPSEPCQKRHGSTPGSSRVTRAGWLGSNWRQPASPQRANLGSGGVALRASIKRPDITLCKAGCYVKTTGHSKPARHENRVSLLGRDESPGQPGTPIAPAFSTVHLISIKYSGFCTSSFVQWSCDLARPLRTQASCCEKRRTPTFSHPTPVQ